MTYLATFPRVDYYFGDEKDHARFPQLNAYVDILDQIKHQTNFYRKYYIGTNERPDNLSFQLYGTAEYHWTFFLVNDDLRASGWPFPEFKAYEVAKKRYPNTSIRTQDLDALVANFEIGDYVKLQSGDRMQIIDRNLNFGQLTLEDSAASDNTGTIAVLDDNSASFLISNQVSEELAIHHYEDADGVWTDIDPRIEVPSGLQPVTNYEWLANYNESLREINVIKPDAITKIVNEFFRKLQ